MAIPARLLALAWAGFWMFFFVAESAATRTPLARALPWVGLGVLFLALALSAWRWEFGGGLALIAAGIASGAAYLRWSPEALPTPGRLFTTLVFGVPPLVAGILFLWDSLSHGHFRLSRKPARLR